MSNILAVVLLQVAAKKNQKLRKYYHQSQMKARHQKIDNRYHYR